jgi:hypothetical protein
MLKRHAIATSVVALGLAALLGGSIASARLSVANEIESDDVVTITLQNDRKYTDICSLEISFRNVRAGQYYGVWRQVGADGSGALVRAYGDQTGSWLSKSEVSRLDYSSLELESIRFGTNDSNIEAYDMPVWTPGTVRFVDRCTAPF